MLEDRQRLGTPARLALAFFCGGVVGAPGFKQLGYVSTLPLALSPILLAGVQSTDDLLALARRWRVERRFSGQRKCMGDLNVG